LRLSARRGHWPQPNRDLLLVLVLVLEKAHSNTFTSTLWLLAPAA